MNKILRIRSIATKLCLPILLSFFCFSSSYAQEASPDAVHKPLIRYYVFAETGGLIGKSIDATHKVQVNYTVSLTQGIRLGNRLSLGGGVGLDSYSEVKALPVFGSIIYDLLGKKNKVFLRFNYGYSSSWSKQYDQYYSGETMKGGKMINPSIGYRINNNVWKIYLALGYKFQAVTTISNYYFYPYYNCPTCDYIAYGPSGGTTEVKHDMKRFSFTMGLGWK